MTEKLFTGTLKIKSTTTCCIPKIQEKRPNLRVFRHKDANGITNSEDPDQTAPRMPRGAV